MKNLLLIFLCLPILGLTQVNILYTPNNCPVEDVLRVCAETEPYAGLYQYETVYSWCNEERTLTGEIEMTVNLQGNYFVDDFSFGTWKDCLGVDEGPLGTVQMRAECSFINGISGTDKFGDLWDSDNFTFENNSFSFNWFNSYGDFGRTTLTPIDGRILNDPTQIIEESDYEVLWSTGETTPIIMTNSSGLFEVTLTSIETGISEVGSIEIDNTSPSFKNECNGEILDVNYFLDTNENGIQESDEINLNVYENFIDFTPNYLLKGYRGEQTERFVLDPQSYTFSVVNQKYASTLASNLISIEENPRIDSLNVGLIPIQDVESLDVYFNSSRIQRCNTIVPYRIRAFNNGTLPYSGMFTVEIDSLLEIISFDTDPVAQNDNTLTWQIDISNPTEYVDIIVYLQLPSADFIGEILCITPINDSATKNFNAYCFELSCAYDPNDKHGVPFRGGDNVILNTESLDYTIRFENLGNDTALNVRVVDYLNTNYDLRTFKLLNSSHVITSHWIDQYRQLHVEFDDIYLPSVQQDSTLNKGFFLYTIDLLPGLNESTKIKNSASIYFDQNDAVITNTMTHTIASQITTSISYLNDIKFSISPNPTQSKLQINLESSYLNGGFSGFLQILDVRGNTVLTQKDVTKEIDVSAFESGVYFLRIYGTNGSLGTAKFLKIK